MAFPKEGAFAGTDRQVFTNGSPGRFSDRQQRRNRQLLGRVDHRYLHEGGKDVVVINASARLIQAGADAVVVAGAAVAGIADRLRTRLPVPLLNGIACAVDQAETLVRLGLRQRTAVAPLTGGSGTTGIDRH